MGLDMYGFSTAERVEVRAFNEGGEPLKPDLTEYPWDEQPIKAYLVANDFHRSFEGLEEGAWYVPGGDTAHWRASYGGYNRVREAISMAAWGVEPEVVWADENERVYGEKDLYRLVHFSDCEGVIGPKACERIARGLQEPGLRDAFLRHYPQPSAETTFDALVEIFVLGSTGLVLFS